MFTHFNWAKALENLSLSLCVMGLGMLSIFIVIILLIAAVYILSKFSRKETDSEQGGGQ